jgi:voltage-gated potassium channel
MKNSLLTKAERVRNVILAAEGALWDILALLSTIAIGLVVANEFVAPATRIPLLSMPWGELQALVRTIIWGVFVAYCATYTLVNKNRFEFLRKHFLELLVCVCWLPKNEYAVFHHFTTLLSINSLQLVWMLAHTWRLARWTIRRFSTHPLIVTGSAALVLVGTASAVLNQIEPQTFPTIWDAGWYVMSTVTTVGYGDVVPKTPLGRAVGVFVMLGGISLAGVFLGLMTEFVRNRLQVKPDTTEDLRRETLDELRTNNQLLGELLEELRKDKKETPGEEPKDVPPEKRSGETS